MKPKRNSIRCLITIVTFLIVAAWLIAATEAASLTGWSRSLEFSSFRDYDSSIGWYDVYFTSKDGLTNQFPLYYMVGGTFTVSDELRQVNQASIFETDFVVWSETYSVWVQYGSMSLYLPVNDANGNTVPDWMERAQPANEIAYTGTYIIDQPVYASYSPYATLTRSAGSRTGNYTLKIGSGPTTQGTWSIGHVSGTVTYNRAAGSVAITASLNDGNPYSGTAVLSVQNHDQVTLGQFTLSRTGDSVATSGATILIRNGNRYVGQVTFQDGNSGSPWPDFLRWVVEITDTVDSDSDGVPDLSDAILSMPTIQRIATTPRFDFPVTPGFAYRILTSTNLQSWKVHTTNNATGVTWQFTPPAGNKGFFRIVSP